MDLAFRILHGFAHNSLSSLQICLAYSILFISLLYLTAQTSVNFASHYLSHNILLNFILFQYTFNHFNFRSLNFYPTLFFVCLFNNLKFKKASLLQSSSLALNLIASSPSIPLGLQLAAL